MSETPLEVDSNFIDLTKVSLKQLKSMDDSVLGRSIRRLVEEIENPRDAVAAWNALILGDEHGGPREHAP